MKQVMFALSNLLREVDIDNNDASIKERVEELRKAVKKQHAPAINQLRAWLATMAKMMAND